MASEGLQVPAHALREERRCRVPQTQRQIRLSLAFHAVRHLLTGDVGDHTGCESST